MPTFYLSAAQLASIATLTHSASAKEAPILGCIKITATPAEIVATASDRYTCARLTFPLGDTVHTLPHDGTARAVLLTAPDAVMLAKARTGVMLTFDDGADRPAHMVTAEADNGTRYTLTADAGNFPPMERLYPDATPDAQLPTGIAFRPDLLARLVKFSLPGERPADTKTAGYRFAATSDREHAPIVAMRRSHCHGGALLEVLIQPAKY